MKIIGVQKNILSQILLSSKEKRDIEGSFLSFNLKKRLKIIFAYSSPPPFFQGGKRITGLLYIYSTKKRHFLIIPLYGGYFMCTNGYFSRSIKTGFQPVFSNLKNINHNNRRHYFWKWFKKLCFIDACLWIKLIQWMLISYDMWIFYHRVDR